MERIRWTDRVRNEEVLGLHRVKVKRTILPALKTRTSDWIGPILHRNFFLKHVLEGKTEGRIDMTGRRRRRRKQVLYKLQQTRGYWKLKEDARDGSLWRSRFGSSCHKTDYIMKVSSLHLGEIYGNIGIFINGTIYFLIWSFLPLSFHSPNATIN